MQRKTNLFYTKTDDSNFLTFSNFTEALTGNFLSTDWKVYPSRFLCLYMPKLEEIPEGETKESVKADFIKNYLVRYYENKLAFLRDFYTEKLQDNLSEFDIEADVNSLAWLFKCISKFDENYQITFLGEVTEFDFKGTYTDTICIIDSGEGYKQNSNSVQLYKMIVNSGDRKPYDKDLNILYGWSTEELEDSEYKNLKPNFEPDSLDEENVSNEYELYSTYELEEIDEDRNYIKFNVIIPLFDITDINYQTNFNEVDENTTLEENIELKNYTLDEETGEIILKTDIDYSEKEKRSINNPLGIWFSDEVIELKRDQNSKYAPSWSLVISSQFKPFPYSNKYQNNDITSKDNQQAFATYAKILSSQSTLSNQINNLYTKVTKLEQIVSSLTNNLDIEKLQQQLDDYKKDNEEMKEKLNNLDSIIEEKVNTLFNELVYKWK